MRRPFNAINASTSYDHNMDILFNMPMNGAAASHQTHRAHTHRYNVSCFIHAQPPAAAKNPELNYTPGRWRWMGARALASVCVLSVCLVLSERIHIVPSCLCPCVYSKISVNNYTVDVEFCVRARVCTPRDSCCCCCPGYGGMRNSGRRHGRRPANDGHMYLCSSYNTHSSTFPWEQPQ